MKQFTVQFCRALHISEEHHTILQGGQLLWLLCDIAGCDVCQEYDLMQSSTLEAPRPRVALAKTNHKTPDNASLLSVFYPSAIRLDDRNRWTQSNCQPIREDRTLTFSEAPLLDSYFPSLFVLRGNREWRMNSRIVFICILQQDECVAFLACSVVCSWSVPSISVPSPMLSVNGGRQ